MGLCSLLTGNIAANISFTGATPYRLPVAGSIRNEYAVPSVLDICVSDSACAKAGTDKNDPTTNARKGRIFLSEIGLEEVTARRPTLVLRAACGERSRTACGERIRTIDFVDRNVVVAAGDNAGDDTAALAALKLLP